MLNQKSLKIKISKCQVSKEKKKMLKKINKKLEDLVFEYRTLKKTLLKYQLDGSDFSKDKLEIYNRKVHKLEKSILYWNSKRELCLAK